MGTINGKGIKLFSIPVHPHVRGDNIIAVFFADDRRGSPPRAWGQSTNTLVSITQLRFTPTCVGTILLGCLVASTRTVHPHVRGDNVQCWICHFYPSGSPPRAWGQWKSSSVIAAKIRFTPTCVGTMGIPADKSALTPVHPHVRGDNARHFIIDMTMTGSPPRAWGQSMLDIDTNMIRRFTPTCVGTILMGLLKMMSLLVHPHVRGDNQPCCDNVICRGGSPPRAWGQLNHSFLSCFHYRFTPTCVGTILKKY